MFLPPKEQKADNLDHIPSFGELKRKAAVNTGRDLPEKKSSAGRAVSYTLIIIFFLAIVFFVWQGTIFMGIYSSFKNIDKICRPIKTNFLAKDFSKTNEVIDRCQEAIYETEQKLNSNNLLPLFGLHKTVEPVSIFMEKFYILTQDFQELNNYFEEFYNASQGEASLLALLDKDLGRALKITANLQNHKNDLMDTLALDNFFLNRIRKKISAQLNELTSLDLSIDQSTPYLELLPDLLAYDSEKTYLLLFQNSSELRPTGGFWGSYGVLKIADGKIIDFKTDDIYHLDVNIIDKDVAPEPPAPLAKYLNKDWFFRDANWSPDFSEAALTAQYFYKLEGGTEEHFDGVIAITPEVIADFLLYLGPIEVNGLSFDRENFISLLQYEVEVAFNDKDISSWNRKDILEPLAEKLINKLEKTLTLDTISEITKIFEKSLAKKDILIYFNDPKLEKTILGYNWGGAIIGTTSDYLDIIDANLASFKTDLYIERQIEYKIKTVPKDNNNYDLVAHLKIEYLHRGRFDWKTTRYRTYTRVYLPPESRLLSWQGVMADDRSSIVGGLDVYNEFGKTVLGGFIAIEPQRGGVLEFEYTLPDRIKEKIASGQYQLIIQKQPGVQNKSVNLDLEFPRAVKKVITRTGDYSIFGNKVIFNGFDLETDNNINIIL